MGLAIDGVSDDDAADFAIEAVQDLSANIGIPATLSAVGVRPDQMSEMVAQALDDPNLPTNPRPCTETDIHDLYTAAM